MGLFGRKKQKRQTVFLNSAEFCDWIKSGEYVSLADNPEVFSACRQIADLVSSMTIYLMSNTDKGDIRIKNELSRQVDITPNQYMTRKTWMDAIVMNLLLYGNGNAVVIPRTENGYLRDMVPVPASAVSFIEDGDGYKIRINGVSHDPSTLLHFVWNPDKYYPWKGAGAKTTLKAVADNLKQASETEKSFMSSKWKPSVIIRVDGMVDEFSTKEGRKKLLEEYVETSAAGEPWIVPMDQFAVDQVRPLSLADLALKDNVTMDKTTVASIMGVPPFLLGVGTYNKADWDNFINTKIRTIAMAIEQELTKKLLINPKWYWKFNVNSLYSYDMEKIASTFDNLYTHGVVTGNEVRDKLFMSPRDGLDELVVLENYLPMDQIGKQKKVLGNEE